MTTRRSIFKCIPAMIAAAVLPKAWTARASGPNLGHVTLHEGMIYERPSDFIFTHAATGPVDVDPVVTTISTESFTGTTIISNSESSVIDLGGTPGWAKDRWMNGPIRVFVDDPDGFATEIQNVVSVSIT